MNHDASPKNMWITEIRNENNIIIITQERLLQKENEHGPSPV